MEPEKGQHAVVLMKKYKLLEKIGSGSFGAIYMCKQHCTQASMSTTRSTTPPKWYLLPHPGEEGKGRRTTALRDQALPTVPGHQYPLPHPAGISKLFDYGNDKEHDRIFMIIELLGKSLEDLFQLW